MRFAGIVTLSLIACSKPQPQNAAVHIDLTPMLQAAESSQLVVSKIGLVAIRGAQQDPAQAKQSVESSQGEATSTTTVDPSAGDQSRSGVTDTPVGGTDGGGDSTPVTIPTGTTTNTNLARGTATATTTADTGGTQITDSPQAATANPVIGSIANGAGSVSGAALNFGFYPVNMASGQSTFNIAVPSGDDQTLMLIAFVTDAASGEDLPVYIGQLEHVTLEATKTVHLDFNIHPAGLVRPEILPPSTLGLVDGAGDAVANLPQLNCLSVATADRTREGFPQTTAARLAIGSLANLSDVQRATGVMILPAGHWTIDCFANYADHVFSLPSDQVITLDVAQGQVYAPSVALVSTKVVAGGSTGGTSTSGSGGGLTVLKPPRIVVGLSTSGSLARGNPVGSTSGSTGTTTVTAGTPSFNLSTQDTDPVVSLQVVNDDMTPDTSFNGNVRLTVSTLDAVFPIGWSPFGARALSSAPRGTDVAVVNGTFAESGLLEISSLTLAAHTAHLVLTATPLDAAGNLLQPTGAYVFSVRSDALCQADFTDHTASLTLLTLTAEDNLVIATRDASGAYATPATTVVGVAEGSDPFCLAPISSTLSLFLNANPPGVLALPSRLDLPATATGQWVLYDELALDGTNLAQQAPPVGTKVPVTIGYEGTLSGSWVVNTRIDAAP